MSRVLVLKTMYGEELNRSSDFSNTNEEALEQFFSCCQFPPGSYIVEIIHSNYSIEHKITI